MIALVVLSLAAAPSPAAVVVDLSDDWVPRMLADDPILGAASRHPYRDQFIRLANAPARADERFLELYGIPPSFAVLGARLTDDARHRCHAEVAQAATGARSDEGGAGVIAAQGHLRCDGLLDRPPNGVLDAATSAGLRLYQREHALIGNGVLDAETREALATDSRELDFRAVLRALRERVVDASGVIEDGSAIGRRGTVLGRRLDCREMRSTDRLPPLPGGAPDLISPLTEAAARALGWDGPQAAAAFFRQRGGTATRDLRLSIPAEGIPAYHTKEMLLSAEIVTGGRRPELRLSARPDKGDDVVLVRWPTTKGGWQPEKTGATSIEMKLKRSAMGDFVWRDLIAAPAWFPPDTTPDEELVRKAPRGGFRLNREVVGPGYRSAYGLVMLVHHRPPVMANSEEPPALYDAQTRTHGTASYRSVTQGSSHGCHRIYSALAIRLASFLLAHRPYIRRGEITAHYRRAVVWNGRRTWLRAESRGYLYELRPPVPVRVVAHDPRGAR